MPKVITSILLSIAVILLLGGGIYFSIKLNFPQLKVLKLFKGFKKDNKTEVSPFRSLMVSLAARVGVGSLAGIALAIYIGGPGTIFWIWIVGIITSINTYCESYLGAKFQERDKEGYKGGPSYYIEKGLNNKKLAVAYAILIIVSYIIGFITIQGNTITTSIHNYYKINPVIIALILTIITAYSIIKGLNRIVNITSKLVPIMGGCYIFLSLIVLILNIEKIPIIIIKIIKDAWNIKKASLGFISTFLIGTQRGVFSTEAGLGTGSIASSCTYSKDKISLGLIQILGIYFTVFIVCTATALIILTSNYDTLIINNINGIELTQYALNFHLGKIGSIVLLLAIILLAYSTIIAGYFYGESSLKYLLKKEKKSLVFLLRIITIILLFIGSLVKATILWNIVDILVEILAIINMYAIIKLRKEIVNDFFKKM